MLGSKAARLCPSFGPVVIGSALLASLVSVAPLAMAQTFEVGQTVPAPRVQEWVTGAAPAQWPAPARLTLVELWTSWCSPCVSVLEEHARLVAQEPAGTLAVLAITDEDPQRVRQVIARAPWASKIGIGCDDHRQTFAEYLPRSIVGNQIPYALLLDSEGRLLWHGDPRRGLRALIDEAVAGRFGLAVAMEHAKAAGELAGIVDRAREASGAGRTDDVVAAARAILASPIQPWYESDKADALVPVAQALAAIKPGQVPTGLRLEVTAAAVKLTQGTDPEALALHADALFVSGDAAKAACTVDRAILLRTGFGLPDDLRKARDRYRAALPTDPTATAPPLGSPTTMTGEQATADFRILINELRLHYCGYDDLERSASARGASFEALVADAERRLLARPQSSPSDFFDNLRDCLLSLGTCDSHFSLRLASGSSPGAKMRAVTPDNDPYFTDLRVVKEGEEMRIEHAPADHAGLIGRRLAELPVIAVGAAPRTSPLLFPTIPSQRGRAEFLLGCLGKADALDVPLQPELPTSPASVSLSLHRGKAVRPFNRAEPSWSLERSFDPPFLTVRVRTCMPRFLAGFGESASVAAREEAFILDLRANGGGDDQPVMQWCETLRNQEFRWRPGAAMLTGVGPSPQRWTCYAARTMRENMSFRWWPDHPEATSFAGRVYVLMDRGVASGGETFVSLIGQIPGAVFLGENTMGCTRYGNSNITSTLPHSGIVARFGWVKFEMGAVRPIQEGVGFLPDYWLDDMNPRDAVSRLEPMQR